MQTPKKTSPTEKGATPAVKKTASKKAAAPKKSAAEKPTSPTKAPAKTTTKKATKAAAPKSAKTSAKLKLRFEIFFTTKFGETILICGAHPVLGSESTQQAPVMEYIDEQKWAVELELDKSSIIDGQLSYTYLVQNQDGSITLSAPYQLEVPTAASSVTIRDAWNAPGFVENALGSDALQSLQGQAGSTGVTQPATTKKFTHRFIITAPQLEPGKAICLVGESAAFGGWDSEKAVLLKQATPGKWSVDLSLKSPLTKTASNYKYGIYDLATRRLESFESGANRTLEPDTASAAILILQNGFIRTN